MYNYDLLDRSDLETFFANRILELRIEKNVSARDMSLSLGQSESYINRIESKKMLPSMSVFFYICDYFQITPAHFFQQDETYDPELLSAIKKLQTLNKTKRKHLLDVIEDME